jgi:TIR domain
MSKVFISYRRDDAAGYAQAIYGRLERHLRRDQIFMDVDTIEPGVDFVTRIKQAVSESDVVIALIGKRWMGELENAPPRIQDPHDFVHLEIATALSRDIRVIPVLVDNASMPRPDGLPSALQPLVRRHALELSNTRFRFDLERVSQAVQKELVPPRIPEPIKRWRPWIWYGSLSVAVIVLSIAASLWFKDGEDKQTATKKVNEGLQVAKLDAEKEEITARVEELRKEIAQVKADNERLQKEKENLQSKIQKFPVEQPLAKSQPRESEPAQTQAERRQQEEELQRKRAELKRKVTQAKVDLESADDQLKQLKEFRSQQSRPSKELDDEIKRLENSLNQLKKNTAALEAFTLFVRVKKPE